MNDILGTPIKFTKETTSKIKSVSGSYLKAHWVDYLLLVFVCFLLGAFDIFVLGLSDNLLTVSYWLHSASRISAFILSAILGVRIGYPKAKEYCEDLKFALNKNRKLLLLKDLDVELFSNFICKINNDVKKNAWKVHISNKLKKLDKHSPNFFSLYYRDKSEEHFSRFNKFRAKILKKRALNYCLKRANLEQQTTEDYINENINILNVKYPRVCETDFNQIGNDFGYKAFKTTINVKSNAARAIGSGIIFTVILTLLIGSIKLSLNEDLLEERIVKIFSIIINSIIDIGLTLWRFLNGYFDSERIVREEDLRACHDKNEILIMYKKTLSQNLIDEYSLQLTEQENELKEIQKEISAT